MSMPNNTKNLLNPELVRGFHRRNKTTLRQITSAIRRSAGNLRAAARELNVSVESLRRWIKQEPLLAEAFRLARTKAVEDSPLLQPSESSEEKSE